MLNIKIFIILLVLLQYLENISKRHSIADLKDRGLLIQNIMMVIGGKISLIVDRGPHFKAEHSQLRLHRHDLRICAVIKYVELGTGLVWVHDEIYSVPLWSTGKISRYNMVQSGLVGNDTMINIYRGQSQYEKKHTTLLMISPAVLKNDNQNVNKT